MNNVDKSIFIRYYKAEIMFISCELPTNSILDFNLKKKCDTIIL